MAQILAQSGAIVTTVRRRAHTAVPQGVALAADLADGVPTGIERQDVVIATVAPRRDSGDSYTSTYPVAAATAVACAQAAGAKALCWVSSTSVYGVTDGGEVTEASPRLGSGGAHGALCAAEDLVLAATTATCSVGVFRAAGLYGPDRDPAGRYRAPDALAGRFGHWVNFVWRDDVCAAVQLWYARALAGDAVPAILNVADGTPLTVAECARLVARADGRSAALVASGQFAETAGASPAATHQRVRVDALRALGWVPSVPQLRDGLLRLGYERLAPTALPYGPQTAAIRAFLRDLAALDAAAHAACCDSWESVHRTPEFMRAERLLAECMVRAHREAERDAAAGPLLQLLRLDADPEAALDAIAEPALGALMAIVVRDLLSAESYQRLVSPFAAHIPSLRST